MDKVTTTAAEYLIRNCTVAYKCQTRWEDLPDDGIPTVRFCDECQKEVHLCTSDKDLSQAIKDNLCVAIEITPFKRQEILMGMIRFNSEN